MAEGHGWAAAVGLRVNDEVLAINGKSLEGLEPEERVGLLADTPRPMTLRVKRYHPEHLKKYGRMTASERDAMKTDLDTFREDP